MFRRRFEQVAVMLLSAVMLMTSTGIVSSLANTVSESSAAPSTSVTQSETSSSTSVTQEGGAITTPSVEQEGGAIVVIDEGNGTQENPYKISTLQEFLSIGGKVNNTASENKYFVLTNDIDLSSVSGSDFANGNGSLVGIDKTLAQTGANVFIVLDGNGYTLKGLNVEIASGNAASIFGTLNAKSVVKNLKIEKPVIKSTSDSMTDIALIATQNKGTISGVTVTYPVLSASCAQNAAFIVAENYGTVSEVTVRGTHTNASAASLENHTISAIGTVGAVAGLNHGTISNVSAINVGMFIPEVADKNVVYGGIVGCNSGSVINSVSTGNVTGGKAADVVGGIVGKAVKPVSGAEIASTLTNNYSLVAVSSSVTGCGIIGADGKSEMMTDCYWSGKTSGVDTMSTDYGCEVNELSYRQYVILPQGRKAVLSANDVRSSVWGKATFELDGEFTVRGEGVRADASAGAVEITAEAAGKNAYATYSAKIMLPTNVGAASAGNTIKQYFRVELLTVAADAKGDGSASDPFVVTNANEFNLLRRAPGMNIVLGNDISVNSYVSAIKGTVDGNGFSINTAKPLATAVYGKVKNLNVIVTADISTAVFGNAVGCEISGVRVALADGVELKAAADNTGILFNKVSGNTVIDNAQVKGNITVSADKVSSIGAFAGLIDGDKAAVTNSGAVATIRAEENITNTKTAIFAGNVTGKEVSITDGYVGGANFAGEYSFIGAASGEKLTVKNILTDLDSAEGAATKYASFSGFDASQFTEWSFDNGAAGFFTGNGGSFDLTLPQLKALATSTAADYVVLGDSTKLISVVNVADGKLTLNVQRAEGVVTVKSIPVTVVNTKTGLSATIHVSNGLEKDAEGRYIIFNAFDLAYVSENIAELSDASFIMQADVDMSVLDSFAPIGTNEVSFSGTFDGNGKTVSGLTIDGNAKVGLFAVLNGATVKNLTIKDATIASDGGYAGVLAGQVTGNSVISGVTVDGAVVTSSDLYASALIGAVDSADGAVVISGVTVRNATVTSESNYVGAVAGRINAKATISGISVDTFKADGANYVAGVVGLSQGDITFADVNVNNAQVSGVSEVSGITSGNATSISNSSVKGSVVSTVAISSAYTAGGIAAVFAGNIENVTVENTKVSAGMAAGIVGKTLAEADLTIKNASVIACEITSSEANTVVAGILAVHNVGGKATISGASVDENTVIGGGAVSAGIVGDCSGADSILSIADSKTLATVNGATTANAVSAAGVLGRIGMSAVNNVTISGVKVGGKLSGAGVLGGIVGIVRDGTKFSASAPIISDSIIFTQLSTENAASAALIIGSVDEDVFGSADISSAVNGVVLTTYGGMTAYASDAIRGGYTDMNSGITPSVNALSTKTETAVELSGLPQVNGFVFDAQSGWISESDERISVVTSTENVLVLKAHRRANISVMAYYVLEADEQVRIPVEFAMVANVSEPLDGKGTAAMPYIIKDAYDLEAMADYADEEAYFVLTEDIVLTDADYEFGGAFYNVGNGIVTIGNASVAFNGNFSGLYDGKVHSITGLRMNGNTFGGLFGATDGAVITDLIINGADISATANAGVLIGRAVNTTIKNVTINNSVVRTTQGGSVVGGVVGVATSSIIENVTLNKVNVETTFDSTSATLEIAGGIAGIYDGLVKNTELYDVTVVSATVGGGIIGAVKGDPANITGVYADADVKAEVAGGVAGTIGRPQLLSVNNSVINGSVEGAEISAGIVARIESVSADDAFNKLNRSLVKDTVIATVIGGMGTRAVVVGEVSDAIAVDRENNDNDVFSNVYYSSYQNALGAFGNEQFNAYQNNEYVITDLSSLSYKVGDAVYNTIELTTEFAPLSENSIVLNNIDGTYKSFTLGGRDFELIDIRSDVDSLVEYDAETSAIRLTAPARENANLVFVYSGGLELAIGITSDYALQGSGTQENPYIIATADDFGFMLNNSNEGVYYILTQDIDLTGVQGGLDFAGNLDGNGYVLYDYTGTSLFGRMSGTLQNIGFVGFDVTDSQAEAVGAVAAVIDGGKVENCYVIATVNANGRSQDAGILAGRAQGGAVISACVTSGRVIGRNALAIGGVVGSAINAQLSGITSTAYVYGAGIAGGIVGEASYCTMSDVTFSNMVESDGKSGNLAGVAQNTTIENGCYDYRTVRNENFVGEGDVDESSLEALATEELVENGAYPAPSSLADTTASAKFETGLAFALMPVKYLAGLGAGTAYNYTDIVVDATVNNNEVKLEKSSGVKIELLPTVDFIGAENEIARYTNPMQSGAVDVNCTIVDTTSTISDKLIGVMLKTKVGAESTSFDFFTTAASQPKSIAAVTLADGALYVNMHLPSGYKFDVIAVDENGDTLATQNVANEGILISAPDAQRISITLNISEEAEDWGLRTLWTAIGK